VQLAVQFLGYNEADFDSGRFFSDQQTALETGAFAREIVALALEIAVLGLKSGLFALDYGALALAESSSRHT
jgi:hypothetical protein